MRVNDGSVQVILPGAVFAELRGVSAQVDHQPDGSYSAALWAVSGSFDLPRLHEPIARLSLSGVYQQGALQIQHAALSSTHLSLSLGAPKDGANPGEVAFPLPVVGRALGLPDLRGEVSARLSLNLGASGPALGADLKARGVALGPFLLGDAALGLALDRERASVTYATLQVGDGTLRASADLGLTADLPLTLHAEGAQLRLEQLLSQLALPGSWVTTTFDGEAQLSGQLAHGFTLRGEVSMHGDSLAVLTRSYLLPRKGAPYLVLPGYENRFDVVISPDRVALSRGQLSLSKTALSYDGWISFDQRLDLGVQGPLDFGELGAITGVRYLGAGQLERGRISGWLDDPAMQADLRLRGFSIEGFPLGEISGGLRYEWPSLALVGFAGEYEGARYRADGTLDLSRPGLPLSLDAHLERGRPRPLAEMMRLGEYLPAGIDALVQGDITVRGPIEAPRISAEASFSTLDLFGEKLPTGAAWVRYQPYGDFVIESSSFQDGAGSLVLAGTMTDAGDLAFTLSGEGLDTSHLDVVDLRAAKVSAGYGLTAALSGTLSAPRLDSQLRIGVTQIGALRFPGSVLNLALAGDRLSLSGSVLEQARVTGEADLHGQLPYRLRVETKPLALDVLLPWLAGTKARAGGGLALSGDLRDPRRSEGALHLTDLTAEYLGVDLRVLGSVDVSLREEALTLAPARVALGGGVVTVHAAASYPLGGALGVDFATSTDLAALRELPQLAPFLPAGLSAVTGDVSITGGAELRPAGLSLLAAASLRGFSLSLDGLPAPLENLDLDLTLTQDNVFLDRLSGTFADGALRGSGELGLSGWSPGRLLLEATLERAELRRPEDGLSASASADVTLAGTLSALTLSGEVLIDRLRYEQPVEVLPSLQDLLAGKQSFATLPPEEPPSAAPSEGASLALDLVVKSPGLIEIENNLVRVELTIDEEQRPFRLTGDARHPTPERQRLARLPRGPARTSQAPRHRATAHPGTARL